MTRAWKIVTRVPCGHCSGGLFVTAIEPLTILHVQNGNGPCFLVVHHLLVFLDAATVHRHTNQRSEMVRVLRTDVGPI